MEKYLFIPFDGFYDGSVELSSISITSLEVKIVLQIFWTSLLTNVCRLFVNHFANELVF